MTMRKPKVKEIKIASLVEADDNPNQMSAGQLDQLRAAMGRFGFLQFPLVSPIAGAPGRYMIVDGHHRVAAGRAEGEEALPCAVLDLTEEEQIALRMSMNKLRGELDLAKVAESMRWLGAHGWDPGEVAIGSGFSAEEVVDLLAATQPSTEELLKQAPGAEPAPEEQADGEPVIVEITLPTRADATRVKRALRKLGGGDMGAGIIKLLDNV